MGPTRRSRLDRPTARLTLLQRQVREVLELIRRHLDPSLSPEERAAALIHRCDITKTCYAEVQDLLRPAGVLNRTREDGSVAVRTAEEARVADIETRAVQLWLDLHRNEAVALLTQTLTGKREEAADPPPLDDDCAWPTSGSLDLGGPGPGRPNSERPSGGQTARRGGEADGGAAPGATAAEESTDDSENPPRVMGLGDAEVPEFYHRGRLAFSSGDYGGCTNVSLTFAASLLVNRGQLYRDACAAASIEAPRVYFPDGMIGNSGKVREPPRPFSSLRVRVRSTHSVLQQ